MSRNARELVALAAIAASAATSCLLIYPLSERTDASHAPPLGSGGAGVETPDTGSTSDASDVGDAATEDDAPASCSLRACRANSKYLEQPVVCQPGCVPAGEDDCCRLLRTNECPFVYPKDAWRNENAVYFGAYAAIESRDFEGRSSPVVNYKLALDELFAARSIPDADNRQHPFVAIICNNDVTTAANDPMFYRKSIAHLVGDVGVPAVVADLPPNVIAPAFAQTREMGKKVFFLSPGAANRDVRAIDDDGGLIWTLSGQPKDLAPGYQALIGRIERYIQANDTAQPVVRVAVVTKDDPTGDMNELRDAVRSSLFFNGRDRKANEDVGNYKEFSLDEVADAAMPADIVGRAVLAFEPHVVISAARGEFTQPGGVASTIVAQSKVKTNLNYPFYVLSFINGISVDEVKKILQLSASKGADRAIHERMLGLTRAGAEDRDVYGEYQTALRDRYRDALFFENHYDAIYYLAYAMARAGIDRTPDGSKISAAMAATTSGTPFKVGKGDIAKVFAAIGQGSGVKLIGAGGSRFNSQDGLRIDLPGLFCFDPFGNQHSPTLVYDPQNSGPQNNGWVIVSAYECVTGF